jgi:hypothetical protein
LKLSFCEHVKQKSPSRLKSELRKKLLPDIDLQTLSDAIAEFLDTRAGESARGKNFADLLAGYLAQNHFCRLSALIVVGKSLRFRQNVMSEASPSTAAVTKTPAGPNAQKS